MTDYEQSFDEILRQRLESLYAERDDAAVRASAQLETDRQVEEAKKALRPDIIKGMRKDAKETARLLSKMGVTPSLDVEGGVWLLGVRTHIEQIDLGIGAFHVELGLQNVYYKSAICLSADGELVKIIDGDTLHPDIADPIISDSLDEDDLVPLSGIVVGEDLQPLVENWRAQLMALLESNVTGTPYQPRTANTGPKRPEADLF